MLVYAPQIDWVFSADDQEFQGHFFSISMKNDFCFLMGGCFCFINHFW